MSALIKQNEKLKKEVINEAKKASLFSCKNPAKELKNELIRCEQVNTKLK